MNGKYRDSNTQLMLWEAEELDELQETFAREQHERENLEARKKLELITVYPPKTDNDRALNYQYEYLKNGSEDARGKLWEVVTKMSQVILAKKLEAEGRRLDPIDFDERVSVAVIYLMRRYTTRVGYCVKKNFVKAVSDAVLYSYKYKTELDRKTQQLTGAEAVFNGGAVDYNLENFSEIYEGKEKIFTPEDGETETAFYNRIADFMDELKSRGCSVNVSNPDTNKIILIWNEEESNQ